MGHLAANKFSTRAVEDMIPRVVQSILEYAAENGEVLELGMPTLHRRRLRYSAPGPPFLI
jgi:hypothetical protein